MSNLTREQQQWVDYLIKAIMPHVQEEVNKAKATMHDELYDTFTQRLQKEYNEYNEGLNKQKEEEEFNKYLSKIEAASEKDPEFAELLQAQIGNGDENTKARLAKLLLDVRPRGEGRAPIVAKHILKNMYDEYGAINDKYALQEFLDNALLDALGYVSPEQKNPQNQQQNPIKLPEPQMLPDVGASTAGADQPTSYTAKGVFG